MSNQSAWATVLVCALFARTATATGGDPPSGVESNAPSPADSTATQAPAPRANGNPYAVITDRNVFRLVPPPPPPTVDPKQDLPVFKISGFVKIGDLTRAMFATVPKDIKESPQYFSLAEGEMENDFELVKIHPHQDAVDVVISGVATTLTISNNGFATAAAPKQEGPGGGPHQPRGFVGLKRPPEPPPAPGATSSASSPAQEGGGNNGGGGVIIGGSQYGGSQYGGSQYGGSQSGGTQGYNSGGGVMVAGAANYNPQPTTSGRTISMNTMTGYGQPRQPDFPPRGPPSTTVQEQQQIMLSPGTKGPPVPPMPGGPEGDSGPPALPGQ